MMATKKRKHINKVLNEDIFNELINDSVPSEKQLKTDDSTPSLNSQTDKSDAKQLNNDTKPEAIERAITIPAVVDHYHKSLYENDKAQGYLKSKGITNPEIRSMLKIGYADGSLIQRLSKKQIEEFKKALLLNDKDEETFKSSLTFPVLDEAEKVICLYGLNIETDKEIPPVYFTDDKNIIFNYKASKIYDEIILTKNILEALSLIALGFQNVICIADDINFNHILKLKENRVKKIVIAFGSSYTEQSRSDILKDVLIEEGFRVKMIYPKGADTWSQAFLNGIDKEFIDLLIGDQKEYRRQEEDAGFKVKKDALNYIFTVGEINYRLAGVKEMFLSNLKVNIRAENSSEKFFDNLDLYSARSRITYSNNLANIFNVESKRIEKDLVKILEYLEDERDKKLSVKDKNEKLEMTEEEKKTGMDFLKSPDLFKQITDDMTTLGYAGEETNKLLVYLTGVSRLTPKPLSIFIQSAASSGKSYLLETLMKLLPEESVKWISSFSDQSFNYLEPDEFLNKIFMVGEALHNDIVEGHIRQMQSENKISRMVVSKDPKTGVLKTIEVKNIVRLVFMMTSTALKLNTENMSRCLVLHVDESADQTKKVHEMQRHKLSFEGYLEEKNLVPQVVKKHKCALRLLEKVKIFNPYSAHVKFPSNRPVYRRGQQQFLGIIEAVSLLRQKQKALESKTDFYTNEIEQGYECDLFDYEIARNLFIEAGLLQGSDDIPAGMIVLYETLRRMIKKRAKEESLKPGEVSFIQSDVRELTELSNESIKRYMRMLVEYEYLQITGGKRHGTRFCYRLREDKPIEKINIADIIPTVDEIKKLINPGKTG